MVEKVAEGKPAAEAPVPIILEGFPSMFGWLAEGIDQFM
jgi:hypothetical protein